MLRISTKEPTLLDGSATPDLSRNLTAKRLGAIPAAATGAWIVTWETDPDNGCRSICDLIEVAARPSAICGIFNNWRQRWAADGQTVKIDYFVREEG